ncbi:MAG: hypothetical protein ACR2PL_19715, partial [Dehalococcoidia bacterium]
MARDFAVLRPPHEQADILCSLAQAEVEALSLETAPATIANALGALDTAVAEPARIAAFLEQIVGRLIDAGADDPVWRPLLERGLDLAAPFQDATWARLVSIQDRALGYETVRSGILRGRRRICYDPEALRILQQTGRESDYALSLNNYAWRSSAETEGLLTRAQRWTQPLAVLDALATGANRLLFQHGEFRRAVVVSQELMAAAERWGSIPKQAEALFYLARARAVLGDFTQAECLLTRSNDLAERLGRGHPLSLLGPWTSSFSAYCLDGDWPAVAAAWERLATDPPPRLTWFAHLAAALTAVACVRAGNVGQARGLLADLLPLLERAHPWDFVHSGAVSVAGAAHWELGESAFAGRIHALALDLLRSEIADYPFCSTELTVARMAALLGEIEEARGYFARARVSLEASGQRPLRAIVDYDEALALVRVGAPEQARVRALLDDAESCFAVCGMQGWIERSQILRRTLNRRRRPAAVSGHPDGLSDREVEILRL